MATDRILLIVNPRSGSRRGTRILDQVLPVLSQHGRRVEVRQTERSGHAAEMVRTNSLEDVAGICLIGGDGTLHEVLNGLMARDDSLRPPLGIIPSGTGNTVAEHLGHSVLLDAAHHIAAGHTRPLDVLRVSMGTGTAYCCNIVGWGGVTDINRTAEKLRWLGGSRYTAAALVHVAFPRPRRLRLTIDGRSHDGEYLFAVACNTRSTGKGMLLAPRADVADGLVDLVLVRNTSRLQLLKVLQKVFDGSHVTEPCVAYHQAREFELAPEAADGLNLDGELYGAAPCHVTVMPQAISVFAATPSVGR
jgi:YegS/Rv2252/BmrU family lipid kinase